LSLPKIALISIFRESVIGGIAIHSSNLYERLVERGVEVERIDYAFAFRRRAVIARLAFVARMAKRFLRRQMAA